MPWSCLFSITGGFNSFVGHALQSVGFSKGTCWRWCNVHLPMHVLHQPYVTSSQAEHDNLVSCEQLVVTFSLLCCSEQRLSDVLHLHWADIVFFLLILCICLPLHSIYFSTVLKHLSFAVLLLGMVVCWYKSHAGLREHL